MTIIKLVAQPMIKSMASTMSGLRFGPNLVVNGNFSNGLTGWTDENLVVDSIVSGELNLFGGTSFSARDISDLIPLTAGKKYRFEGEAYKIESLGGNVRFLLQEWFGGFSTIKSFETSSLTKVGFFDEVNITNTGNYRVICLPWDAGSSGANARFDNMKLREVI